MDGYLNSLRGNKGNLPSRFFKALPQAINFVLYMGLLLSLTLFLGRDGKNKDGVH